MNFGKNAGDLECVFTVGGNSSRPLKELAKVRFIYVYMYVYMYLSPYIHGNV